MYRFAIRPRWLLTHLLVVSVLTLFVVAGFWQLSRLDERRERNAEIEDGLREPPVDLNDRPPDARLTHRRGIARGRYDTRSEVLLVGRGYRGDPGNHVLTPLVLDDGRAVIVNRGAVSPADDTVPIDRARPPSDAVSVEGILLPSERGGRITPDRSTSAINLAALEREVGYDLLPTYLLLQRQRPEQSGPLPLVLPPPRPDEGPHLGYAIQWFLFVPIALVVYVAILRQQGRRAAVAVSP